MRRILAVLLLLSLTPALDARPRPVRRLVEAVRSRMRPPPPLTSTLHVYPNGTSSTPVGGGLYDIAVSWQAIYPGSIILEGPANGNALTFGQSGTAIFTNYPPGNYRTRGLCGGHGDFSPWLNFTVP